MKLVMADEMIVSSELLDSVRELFPWLVPHGLRVEPNLDAFIFDQGGKLLWHEQVQNKVTLSGRNIVRDLLGRGVQGTGDGYAPRYMAVGTGTTAVADGDTALETEVYRALLDHRQGFASQIDAQMYLSTDDANGNTLTEAGLFDSPVAGNMLCRALFGTPIVKTNLVQAVLIWSHSIAST